MFIQLLHSCHENGIYDEQANFDFKPKVSEAVSAEYDGQRFGDNLSLWKLLYWLWYIGNIVVFTEPCWSVNTTQLCSRIDMVEMQLRFPCLKNDIRMERPQANWIMKSKSYLQYVWRPNFRDDGWAMTAERNLQHTALLMNYSCQQSLTLFSQHHSHFSLVIYTGKTAEV